MQKNWPIAASSLLMLGCNSPTPEGPVCAAPDSLVITEVMANPMGTDRQEWIEIHNPTADAVDLSEATLYVGTVGTRSHTLSGGRVLPGSFYVLAGIGRPNRPAWVDYDYGDALGLMPNGAALLGMRCGDTVIDEVAYLSTKEGSSNQLDGTLTPSAANNDSLASWCTSTQEFEDDMLATPGEWNGACLGLWEQGMCAGDDGPRPINRPAPGDIVISEYMANPAASADSTGEWVEVWVSDAVEHVDLNGLTLLVGADRTPAAQFLADECLSVEGGTYLVFARSADPAENGGIPQVDHRLSTGLINQDISISIAVDDVTLHQIEHGTPTSGVSFQIDGNVQAGEPNPPWCLTSTEVQYGAGDHGTPGAPNGACAPMIMPGQCLDQGRPRDIIQPALGDIFISEFLANPTAVSDANGEWLELYLLQGADLNGLLVASATASASPFDSSECIWRDAGSVLLLARNGDPQQNGGLPAVDGAFGFSILNSDGLLRLESSGGVLHEVTYSATEAGSATSLDLSTVSGPETWCSATTPYGGGPDTGTPGALNPLCP